MVSLPASQGLVSVISSSYLDTNKNAYNSCYTFSFSFLTPSRNKRNRTRFENKYSVLSFIYVQRSDVAYSTLPDRLHLLGKAPPQAHRLHPLDAAPLSPQ